jgi:hypothetical protein
LDPEIEALERWHDALQRDICELQIVHDLLNIARELKKGLDGDLHRLC